MVRISAVIPVFNQEKYLGEAIDSILAQTYRDFELIVVDDGSTDKTPEVIASYGSRIRAIRQPNRGNASALNVGVREARGKWIGWLSSDDLWEPTKLERQMQALGTAPDVGLIYSDVMKIDSNGHPIGRDSFACPPTRRERLLLLIRRNYINGITTLISHDVFDEVGFFDERDRLTSDYDMWLRIVTRFDILHIPEVLARYRIHPGQGSTKQEALQRSSKRVATRVLHDLDPVAGAVCVLLRLKDEISTFPWRVMPAGGGFKLSTGIRGLTFSVKVLVNQDTP